MAIKTIYALASKPEFQALCQQAMRDEAIKVLKDVNSTAAQIALAKASFGSSNALGIATWFLSEQESTGNWPQNRLRAVALRTDPAPPEITADMEQRIEQFPGIYFRPQAELVCSFFGITY